MLLDNIGQAIGNTPLLRLRNLEKHFNTKAKIYAKLDGMNPAGSSKDRVALSMIEDAENKNLLNKNSVIVEPTSGNTGIGLASICASKGYKLVLTMPETMSIERRKLISAYGAEIVLTEGSKGMQGAVEYAKKLVEENKNCIILGQFDNFANPKAHYDTTAPEIWKDLDGNIDIFVATFGTGGTVSGCGKFFKEKNKNIKIIAVEPDTSPLVSKGYAGPHKIQGIGANFVPKILDKTVLDTILTTNAEEAFVYSRLLGKKEGFLAGISSGACLAIAIQQALLEENSGKTIVAFLPDTGERYLSTQLFEV